MTGSPHADAIRQLAPTGVIRVGLNTGNAATVTVTSTGFEGPAPRLIEALHRWAQLPVEIVCFSSASELMRAAGAWDVAFLAIDPAREDDFRFTKPYLTIDAAVVVRVSSGIATVADLNKQGVRLASSQGAAYDSALCRDFRHIKRTLYGTPRESFDGFEAQQLDGVAGIKEFLERMVRDRSDLRLLPERIATIEHAMAVARDRPLAAALLDTFMNSFARR